MNPAENEICPYCGAPAVDITIQKDPGKRWLCIGMGAHEWTEGDVFEEIPESPEPSAPPRPSMLKRLLHSFSS